MNIFWISEILHFHFLIAPTDVAPPRAWLSKQRLTNITVLTVTSRTAGLRPAFCSLLSLLASVCGYAYGPSGSLSVRLSGSGTRCDTDRVLHKVWQGLVQGVTKTGTMFDKVWYKMWQSLVQGVKSLSRSVRVRLGPSGSVNWQKPIFSILFSDITPFSYRICELTINRGENIAKNLI